MRIGLDFDNTLVCYDHAFYQVARALNLLPDTFEGKTKQAVKTFLQMQGERGELQWQMLQGQVYGAFISKATWFEGVFAFLKYVFQQEHDVFIVSHKTQYGHFDRTRTDLREAARHFMEAAGFFSELGFKREHLFFLPTRDEKIEKIRSLKLDLFVDDLFAVLTHPHFPKQTQAYWFVPHLTPQLYQVAQDVALPCVQSWEELLSTFH